MKKIITLASQFLVVSGILLFSTLPIVPMQKATRKLAPFIRKNLTGGQKRDITGFAPEIAEVAIVLTSLYCINAKILIDSKKNDDKAQANNVAEAFKAINERKKQLDFHQEIHEFGLIKQDKIPAGEQAFINLIISTLITASTGAVGGAEHLHSFSNPSELLFYNFYLGQLGTSVLSLNAYRKLQKENEDLSKLILEKAEKEQQQKALERKVLLTLNHIKFAGLKK